MAALPQQIQNAYARLSLPPGADAETVMQAYARALEQINQEGHAEAVGNLRAAYETAMAWATQAPQHPLEEPHPPAAQAPTVNIEAALREWLDRILDREQTDPHAVLSEALRDERLLSPAAREALETRVATVLVHDPWRRVDLFDAAVACFHWDTGNGGRLADRWTAAWIAQACSESMLWHSQGEQERLRQTEAIDAALAHPAPSQELLERHFFAMDTLMSHFGYWLILRMPNAVLQAWTQAYNAPDFKPPALPAVRAPRTRFSFRPTPQVLLFGLAVILAVLRIAFNPNEPPAHDGSAADPYPQDYARRDTSRNQPATLPSSPSSPPAASPPAASPPAASPDARTARRLVDRSMTRYAGSPPRPFYPAEAKSRQEQGRVVVRIEADELGHITSTRIEESSGHPLLDEAALASLKGVRFKPILDAGRPIRFSALLPFDFRLADGARH